MDIAQRLTEACNALETGRWLPTDLAKLLHDARADIERLDTFRSDTVAAAAAALDSRSHSRCVYALEEIFRKGSRR